MPQKLLEQYTTNCRKAFLEDKEKVEQFKAFYNITSSKGLADKIKSLELGLAKTLSCEDVPEEAVKELDRLCLFDSDKEGSLFMPLRDSAGRIVNILYLSMNGKPPALTGGGLANLKALSSFKQINTVDTVDDFMTHYLHVKENVVPIMESTETPGMFAGALKNAPSVEEVTFLFNSPRWKHVRPLLEDAVPKIYNIAISQKSRLRKILEKKSATRFTSYLAAEKAKLLAGEEAETEKKNPGGENRFGNCSERLKIFHETGELRFEAEDRTYSIKGFNKDGFEKRVQISLELDERSFPDKVDLSRHASRAGFANSAFNELQISSEVVKEDLTFIYRKLDAIQNERFKEKAGLSEKRVYIVTPDDLKKAADIASKRDILDELLMKDTERIGFMDEDVNKKLFYIAATSRLTGKPISVLDISPSGTGKSFCMERIIDLMPPDETRVYSRLTPMTLYYKDEEDIRDTAVFIEELTGIEDALESVRMIVSAEMLSNSGVEKDSRTGQMRSVERRIKASIPIISGGTRDLFDEETLSRFILTYNDLSREHIKRILKAQARKYSHAGTKANNYALSMKKRHRDIQKSFNKNCVVIIPFSDRIMLNPKLHIVTRKQEQYLRLIYNIAYIRQHSRESRADEGGAVYIEAVKEDVITANELMRYVFQFAGSDLTKRQYDAFQAMRSCCMQRVKEKRIELYEYGFSRRELREYTGWEQTTAKRFFDELESLEYIRRVRGGRQGTQFLYRLVPFNERSSGAEELNLLDPETL